MHILIAPNAFKNSLEAASVSASISKGLRRSSLSCRLTCFPLGDGGDGTGSLLIRHFNGTLVPSRVSDPLGRIIDSSFGLIDQGRTAVIELAAASGLAWLKPGEYDPLHATTRGTGEMIRQALDLGVRKIILAIGGSATVDGGAGILEVLGIRFFDAEGKPCKDIPEALTRLAGIDDRGLDPRLAKIKMDILCDVENTLLGVEGAVPVFGPQKGANEIELLHLENGLENLRSAALDSTGKDMAGLKYGGAAGGVSSGLAVFLGARLYSGIEYFLDCTGFDQVLKEADLLITAEGSMDAQTLGGKGPLGAAKRARTLGIPVIALAGKVPAEINSSLNSFFDAILPISPGPTDLEFALRNTASNLERTARTLGDLMDISGHLTHKDRNF
jgi:glycerate 2-kinase